MNSIRKTTIEPRLWPRAFRSALRGAILLTMLTLSTALASYGDVWYSGATVASNGTVLGWGVTDITNYSMYHQAWATTTLTSPVKHRQASYTNSAQNWTRADVSLPFDSGDLGLYLVSSTHTGYCFWCYCFYVDNETSAAYVTVGYSVICYHRPTYTGGKNCNYVLKEPCAVTCAAQYANIIAVDAPPCPPVYMLPAVWYQTDGPTACVYLVPIVNPGCVCSQGP